MQILRFLEHEVLNPTYYVSLTLGDKTKKVQHI